MENDPRRAENHEADAGHRDHIAGAAAAHPIGTGLGAAIGGALPRSKVENDTLGETSDRLFDEAQAVYREERARAMTVLTAAADEAKMAVKDAGADLANLLPEGKSVGQVIVDQVTDATNRVVDTAKEEADRLSGRRA